MYHYNDHEYMLYLLTCE